MLTNPPVPINLSVQALPTSLLCDYEIFANLRLKLYVSVGLATALLEICYIFHIIAMLLMGKVCRMELC